ncbi:MAG: N-acetylmuramoyl-L-alanine amidase [Chthoniobacteraceae bacterium]
MHSSRVLVVESLRNEPGPPTLRLRQAVPLFYMRQCISWAALVALIGCFLLVISPGPQASPETDSYAGDTPNPTTPANPGNTAAAGLDLTKSSAPVNNLLPIIVIDPGHGGHDEGAYGFGIFEKNLALDIALRLERHLQQYHLLTVLTRRSDVYVSLADRTAIANRYDHSIFVSIHANQCAEPAVDGIEIYYANEKSFPDILWSWIGLDLTQPPPPPDTGKTLATSIQDSLTGDLSIANRGIKERNLYVVSHVQNPAVLVECGFLSNQFDATQFASEDYLEKLAASLAKGIVNYQATQQLQPEKPAPDIYASYSTPAATPAEKTATAAPSPAPSRAIAASSVAKTKSIASSHPHPIARHSIQHSAHRTIALHKHRTRRVASS